MASTCAWRRVKRVHLSSLTNESSATRQACSVYLKNRVLKSYEIDASRQRPDQIPIPKSDKEALKASILPLIVASPSKSVTVQLGSTLKTMISHDFPEKWPDLIDTAKTLLSSDNTGEVSAGCIVVLEIVRVYR